MTLPLLWSQNNTTNRSVDMTDTQKQTRSLVQEKLSNFIKKITTGVNRPVAKFIRDMVSGICSSATPSVHGIAQHIQDRISTKKTSERLYRNLGRKGLFLFLIDALMDIVCPKLKDDSIIIVDESDIEKPYAKKMEGCKLVRNGSKGTETMGYNLLNIVACLDDGNGYRLLPISSDLISTEIELDSTKEIMFDRLNDILIKSNGRGVFVFDRGYDDRKIIDYLVDNGASFVIRGVGKRNILEDTTEVNFKKALKSLELIYELPGYKPGEKLRCGTRRIGVRTSGHPSGKASSVEVSLVVGRRFKNGRQIGDDFYLICDFADPNLSEREIIQRAINAYNKRWRIEEVHRQMKQDLQWEKMLVRSYDKLKNLNMLMTLALYFIYSCRDLIEKIAVAYPKLVCFRKKEWSMLYKFSYYRLSKVSKLIFLWNRYYDTSPFTVKKTEPYQMKIRLL